MKKLFIVIMVIGLVVSSIMADDGTIKLKFLGRASLIGPIENAAMAKQAIKNYLEEIRKIENDELFFDLVEQLDNAEVRKETIPIGAVMRWMMFKDRKNSIRHIKNIEWAGLKAFQAFGFEIVHDNKIYHFAIPNICGNICLLDIREKPEKLGQPEKPIEKPRPKEEPEEPEQPKAITPPGAEEQSLPAPTKKHRPNIKIHAGPWIPWEPINFSAENPSIDVNHDFQEYLPKYERFQYDKESTLAQIYLSSKIFPYQTGDNVLLKQQRSLTTNWSGIQFNVGLEIRLWKELWIGADYYQSRKLHVSLSEYAEDMYFKKVKYLGYYTATEEPLDSCPPEYYRYCLDLNRRASKRQTDYAIVSREIHLVLRYYLNIGKFSLAPTLGLADQQFAKKMNEKTVSTTFYPWKDKIISESGSSISSAEKNNYQITWTAGLTAEVKLLKFLSVSAEASYQKFSEEGLNYESIIMPAMDSVLKTKPWRATATLKVLF